MSGWCGRTRVSRKEKDLIIKSTCWLWRISQSNLRITQAHNSIQANTPLRQKRNVLHSDQVHWAMLWSELGESHKSIWPCTRASAFPMRGQALHHDRKEGRVRSRWARGGRQRAQRVVHVASVLPLHAFPDPSMPSSSHFQQCPHPYPNPVCWLREVQTCI